MAPRIILHRRHRRHTQPTLIIIRILTPLLQLHTPTRIKATIHTVQLQVTRLLLLTAAMVLLRRAATLQATTLSPRASAAIEDEVDTSSEEHSRSSDNRTTHCRTTFTQQHSISGNNRTEASDRDTEPAGCAIALAPLSSRSSQEDTKCTSLTSRNTFMGFDLFNI